MSYRTRHIKGKGRGKVLGFPTINLSIPETFDEKEGIYAAWVYIKGKKFKGALHYGPVPTFHEPEKSLEVFILDANEQELVDLEEVIIELELVKKIRKILSFNTPDDLSSRIKKDVKEIKRFFSRYNT